MAAASALRDMSVDVRGVEFVPLVEALALLDAERAGAGRLREAAEATVEAATNVDPFGDGRVGLIVAMGRLRKALDAEPGKPT